ncbi:P-loop containing nucleoside triphosphate hydrolase protein [Teratosphaeria nubilosa]|uniref:P-loop containing nucleoside triphosphate hydrolase protein n=1 Tax=Teratosphaeria nubilosa TaxID=161662 RepID=A0A6G1KUI1_9PEZI|nr:P-loop containing nucleoside triphosphate hydrolase protein [Teratosphaeria nubilosa]
MVLPKSKQSVGLGNALMNDRFRNKATNMHKTSAQHTGQIKRRDQQGNEYLTPGKKEADWVKMRSVTEQGALDEFLSTAELAGTDFTAEKMNNVKIIHTDQKNPYLLSADQERGVVRKQNAKRKRLTVPRRPPWDESTTPQELDRKEKASMLEWRRGLAELQEVDDLLLTPFERNLEVWRQLWRVIERSDLVVQIVDARNPLLFRSEDLENYVKEVDTKKRNLLLVNKADMMTLEQRTAWADWFVEHKINFRFFSAELARETNEARQETQANAFDALAQQEDDEEDSEDDDDEEDDSEDDDELIAQEAQKVHLQDKHDEDEQWVDEETVDGEEKLDGVPLSADDRTRILTTDDLEDLFLQHSPKTPDASGRKTSIGLVGYPNVGKSSTINALLGAKKVSVSATPGKTKHFQTIHLSDRVILCDCPGLVFPNFATTKAELVCSGVLPIDQLRECTGPAALVAQRIPRPFLEAVYGMKINVRAIEEGGTGVPTGEEMLRAYARARGYYTQGVGQPDESRAVRQILKDYVKGKLLFCHPPPSTDGPGIDARHFNRELYDIHHLPQKRQAQLAAESSTTTTSSSDPSLMDAASDVLLPPAGGAKTRNLDQAFFAHGGAGGQVVQPFHYKYSEQGKALSGRKFKALTALEKGVDVGELKCGKRHFKGHKRMGHNKGKSVPRGGAGAVDD